MLNIKVEAPKMPAPEKALSNPKLIGKLSLAEKALSSAFCFSIIEVSSPQDRKEVSNSRCRSVTN